MATRRELKEAIGQRYRAAGRWERRQILDEFSRVTGYTANTRCGSCIDRSCRSHHDRANAYIMRRCARRWGCYGRRPNLRQAA